MNLLGAKIAAMVLMGTLALFFGLIPLKVKSLILKGDENSRKRRRRERVISGLLCFGSGVLIATVFIHMIPETREGFQRVKALREANAAPEGQHAGHSHAAGGRHLGSRGKKTLSLLGNGGEEGQEIHQHFDHDHHDSHDHPDHHDHLDHHDHPDPHDHHNHDDHGKNEDKHNHNPGVHDHDTHDANHDHDTHSHGTHEDTLNTNTHESEHSSHNHGTPGDEHVHHDHITHEAEHDHHDHGHVEAEHDPHDHSTDGTEPTLTTENHTPKDLDYDAFFTTTAYEELHQEDPSHSNHGPDNDRNHDANVADHSGHNHEHFHPRENHEMRAMQNETKQPDVEEIPDTIEHDHEHEHGPSHTHTHSHGHGHVHEDNDAHSDHDHAHAHELQLRPEGAETKPLVTDMTHERLKPSNDIEPDFKDLSTIIPEEVGTDASELPSFGETESVLEETEPDSGALNRPQFLPLAQPPKDTHTHEGEEDGGHDHGEDHDYPLAELVICIGFFLIYFIEEVLHKILFHHSDSAYEKKTSSACEDAEGGAHTHTHIPPFHSHAHTDEGEGEGEEEEHGDVPTKATLNNGRAGTRKKSDAEAKQSMSPRCQWSVQGVDNPVFTGDIDATTWNPKLRNSITSNVQVSPLTEESMPNGGSAPNGAGPPSAPFPPHPLTEEEEGDAPKKTTKTKKKGAISTHILANVRSLLVVVALSFHAVFEGMAVGLQEVQEDVWYLFIAISAHKFVIAFCIGLELLMAGTPLVLLVMYMLILALVTPVGVGIGIIVTESASFGGAEHCLVITILQGLAGGTLLYVAFLEVLERERMKRGGRIVKLFCLALGFALMASLEAVGGHSHGPVEGQE